MAITIAESGSTKDGTGVLQIWCGTVTFDAAYAAGGEPFDPTADLGRDFNNVFGVWVNNAEPLADGGGYVVDWDATNSVLIVKYADYDAVADGQLIDNAVADISSLTCHVLVIGN